MRRRLLLFSPLALLARLRGQTITAQPHDPADLTLNHFCVWPAEGALTAYYTLPGDARPWGHHAMVRFERGLARKVTVDGVEQDIAGPIDEWTARLVATIEQQMSEMLTRRAG